LHCGAALRVDEYHVLKRLSVAWLKLARFAPIIGLKKPRQRNQFPSLALPQFADRKIGRDAIDISRKSIRGLITIRCPIDSDKSFLRQIDCAVVITRHAIDITRDRIAITSYQFRKRILITGPYSLDQRVIGRRSNGDVRGQRRSAKTQLVYRTQRVHQGR